MMNKERDELWRAIEILTELGEKDLAFRLRCAYDHHFRGEWKWIKKNFGREYSVKYKSET